MNERQATILCHLVDQYIKAAQPVSSRSLGKNLHLAISEATIRNILHYLDEAGFILQPHTSAGRVPTDHGYRYYVDSYRCRPLSRTYLQKISRQYVSQTQSLPRQKARIVARLLSRLTGNIAVAVWLDEGDIQDAGLAGLLTYLASDGSENDVLGEVAHFLQNIDRRLPQLVRHLQGEGLAIHIGQENPYFNYSSVSILAKYSRDAGGRPVILMIVGPRRIPYHRHLALLENFSELMNKY